MEGIGIWNCKKPALAICSGFWIAPVALKPASSATAHARHSLEMGSDLIMDITGTSYSYSTARRIDARPS